MSFVLQTMERAENEVFSAELRDRQGGFFSAVDLLETKSKEIL